MFVRRATSLCHQAHFIGVATSFAVRQLHFVSANIMKLRYAQMKFATKVAKRSCVLADTNTKNKGLLTKSFVFWRRHPDLNWGIRVLQTRALPLGYGAILNLAKKMERMTRLELATSTLARWRSTR